MSSTVASIVQAARKRWSYGHDVDSDQSRRVESEPGTTPKDWLELPDPGPYRSKQQSWTQLTENRTLLRALRQPYLIPDPYNFPLLPQAHNERVPTAVSYFHLVSTLLSSANFFRTDSASSSAFLPVL